MTALAETGRFSERWQMDLDLGLIRRFRDDSRGDLLQIRAAQLAVATGPDAPPGPWAQSALTGLSAELRRFEDGEILAVDHSEHLVGGDRQFEVLDFILPVISPKVPSMRSGEALTTNTRWPLMLGSLGKLTGLLRADWALEGSERLEGQPCWRIRYSGDWLSRLRQGQGDRRSWVEVEAMGQASGTLWMSKADGGLVRHDFRWSRVLRLPLHGSAESVLAQSQAFSGSLVRQ